MIEINNLVNTSLDEKLLKSVGEKILKKEGVQKPVNVSVALVGKEEIQRLNKEYRGKDEPTDVLSFENGSKFVFPISRPQYLGEIVICSTQTKGKGEEAIQRVFIHGLLHLLGYEHKSAKEAQKMRKKEQLYLNFFKNFKKI